jgi:glutamate/tyrosine decarboxylase-like PLP-dependent enzyme
VAQPDSPTDALRAWFLGPRAENASLFERLVLESLRDHVFWRRNHHPEDGFTIHESDRRQPGYDQAVARLTEELLGLLAALKRDVPFFSGRYLGHMLGEQTIAAQVGYFAAMLYNPNNVAAEVSPVTTRLELEAAAQLGTMIGYDPATSWGHLASGGTVANFEALWIARGVRYLPVALALAARDLGVALPVDTLADGRADIRALPLWALLNLRAEATLDAHRELYRLAPRDAVAESLDAHSLAAIGYQDYTRRLAEAFDDPLPAGVVLVAATAHYSWEKIMRALGIGARRMMMVPVDDGCRMDPGALWRILEQCAAERRPVLALVSVCGTTEEGAVDRLDLIADLRERAARELGLAFHLHSDACYGGYAAAITRAADGHLLSAHDIRTARSTAWPSEEWLASMTALARADSVTIDPHKLGYVPYPAGALLLRDRRSRELVALEPPYLKPTEDAEAVEERFLGRWILEGSKPGAAAAAVWLSHRVVPLDERGYGHLIARTIDGAHQLHDALGSESLAPFGVVRFPRPDLNIVNWVMMHPSLVELPGLNAFNEAIYSRLSPAAGDPPYLITRTRLTSPAHDGAVEPLLSSLGVTGEAWQREGLVVLRATVMDPFFAEGAPTPDHLHGFLASLRATAEEVHADMPAAPR